MPCTDPGAWRDSYSEVSSLLEGTTQLLCSLCTLLVENGHGSYIKQVDNLPGWWKQHQEDDRKRVALEQKQKKQDEKKKRALAKLSPKERELLGVWED